MIPLDPSRQLRKAYFDKINPIIPLHDGLAVENSPMPYAIITILPVENSNIKDQLYYEDITVNIDIVSAYEGQKQVDDKAQLILNAIYSDICIPSFTLTDFQVVGLKHSFIPINRLATKSGYISRKIISFKQNLKQK